MHNYFSYFTFKKAWKHNALIICQRLPDAVVRGSFLTNLKQYKRNFIMVISYYFCWVVLAHSAFKRSCLMCYQQLNWSNCWHNFTWTLVNLDGKGRKALCSKPSDISDIDSYRHCISTLKLTSSRILISRKSIKTLNVMMAEAQRFGIGTVDVR